MENTLSTDVVNQIAMAVGLFIGLKVAIWMYILSLSWSLQLNFGNYLYHTHPNSWLRKIWWSMCENDGICDYCLRTKIK